MLLWRYLFLEKWFWIFVYKACSRIVLHSKQVVNLTLDIMISHENTKIKMKIEQATVGSV